MNRILRTAAVSLALSLAASSPGLCADVRSDWTRVERLKPASRVVVDVRSGSTLVGSFLSADTARLEIDVAGRAYVVARSEVVRVTRIKQRIGRRTMQAVGGAAGVAIGIAIGAIYDAQHPGGDDPGAGKLVFGVLGFFGGVAAGAVAGAHGAHEDIIYEAPRTAIEAEAGAALRLQQAERLPISFP